MSTNLFWRPLIDVQNRVDSEAPIRLVDCLKRQYKGPPFRLSQEDRTFLEGLDAADVDGAKALLLAIKEYSAIEVWLES